jgi:serine protease Do
VRVSIVEEGSAAQAAGLRAGDVLLGLNGGSLPRFFPAWLHEHAPGEKITLHVHRDDKELDISYALGETEDRHYSIAEVHDATEKQKRLRNAWLAGRTE